MESDMLTPTEALELAKSASWKREYSNIGCYSACYIGKFGSNIELIVGDEIVGYETLAQRMYHFRIEDGPRQVFHDISATNGISWQAYNIAKKLA